MPRKPVIPALAILLAAVVGFAGWRLLRPYDPGSAAVAGVSLHAASLTRDRSFFWLELEPRGEAAALSGRDPGPLLRGSGGLALKPATIPAGIDDAGSARPGRLRFWLDSADLAGTLWLDLAGGSLAVKRSPGIPPLADGETRRFRSPNW